MLLVWELHSRRTTVLSHMFQSSFIKKFRNGASGSGISPVKTAPHMEKDDALRQDFSSPSCNVIRECPKPYC